MNTSIQLSGLSCSALLEDSAADEDTTLFTTALRVLHQVHCTFFSMHPTDNETEHHHCKDAGLIPDVRDILENIRSNILKDCCILFSRVIPKNYRQHPHEQQSATAQDSDTIHGAAARHPLWQMARFLGARCLLDTDELVTHVIAADTTAKVAWAKQHGKCIVTPGWLIECCAYLFCFSMTMVLILLFFNGT